MKKKWIAGMGVAAMAALASPVWAGTVYWEGFEDAGWAPGGSGWNNYNGGDIVRVASGSNGVTSSEGSFHAEITNLSVQDDVFDNPSLGALSPYTVLDGYSGTFGGGFSVSLDIYLDPTAWSEGDGFDWSTAVSNQAAAHLRDFIWHVGVVGGDLLVNASNNTDRSQNPSKLTNENGGNYATITTAGWYTFESVFYDNAGDLAVDFNLYETGVGPVHSITRTTSDDIATIVGGNRYGWFTYNNIDRLAVDATHLETNAPIPEPATISLLGLGIAGLAMRRARKRS